MQTDLKDVPVSQEGGSSDFSSMRSYTHSQSSNIGVLVSVGILLSQG